MLRRLKFNKIRRPLLKLFSSNPIDKEPRESIDYDVVIVGGGPAGLSTAIRLKQKGLKDGKDISVCLIEKGAAIGSHILSGNCFISDSFSQLFPNWEKMRDEERPPINQPVTKDEFSMFFGKDIVVKVPKIFHLSTINNKGNYIISLGEVCSWMAERAEELGVDIFSGFAANEILYNKSGGKVLGIATGDFGIGKDGKPGSSYQRGIEIKAKQTVFAEGARGSLTEKVIDKFNLRKDCEMQSYGIGLKEVWEVPEENLVPGLVTHTMGWPLERKPLFNQFVYGGSFMYHMGPNLIHLGLVIGLDYKNPFTNPYKEFQLWKTHKEVKKYLKGGTCIKYGARVLNEGGYFSIPKLTFPGGLLVGCGAGLLDIARIKGAHNAIESGIHAADAIFYSLNYSESMKDEGHEIVEYEKKMRNTDMFKKLKETRNVKGGMARLGKFPGMAHSYISDKIGGREPWDIKGHRIRDAAFTEKKELHEEIEYPKPDGKISFDLLENLQNSGTHHDHDQPSHLVVKKRKQDFVLKSYYEFGGPETRFCPANVYEFVDGEDGKKKLQINSENCLHCKTCSIKMIGEYIDWNVPQGSEGPEYTSM